MNTSATVRVLTGGGEVWEEPSEDLLYMLLTDLVDEGGGHFDIVRLDPAESAFKVSFDGSQFHVIRKESDTIASLVATSDELYEIHAACTRWAHQIDAARAAQSRPRWNGFDGSLPWLEVSE